MTTEITLDGVDYDIVVDKGDINLQGKSTAGGRVCPHGWTELMEDCERDIMREIRTPALLENSMVEELAMDSLESFILDNKVRFVAYD